MVVFTQPVSVALFAPIIRHVGERRYFGPHHVLAIAATSTGSKIDGSSFSDLLTRAEIGYICRRDARIAPATSALLTFRTNVLFF
jgi:hypothetical protein